MTSKGLADLFHLFDRLHKRENARLGRSVEPIDPPVPFFYRVEESPELVSLVSRLHHLPDGRQFQRQRHLIAVETDDDAAKLRKMVRRVQAG